MKTLIILSMLCSSTFKCVKDYVHGYYRMESISSIKSHTYTICKATNYRGTYTQCSNNVIAGCAIKFKDGNMHISPDSCDSIKVEL